MTPGDLITQWRQRAQVLTDYGDPNSARLWLLAAQELERALEAMGSESLSLGEAAALSGYTADHLGQLVRAGRIPNAGRRNAPRIRRGDLPTKDPKRGRPAGTRAVPTGDITNLTTFRRR